MPSIFLNAPHVSLSFHPPTLHSAKMTTSETSTYTINEDIEHHLYHSGLSNSSLEENGTTVPSFGDQTFEYIFDRSEVQVIFLILYTIVFCSCFFGNLMVILVVTLHWRMRSITNFCLANLAFADLCVGIFCVYQNIVTYLMESWIFGEFMCKMYHFINSLSTTASIFILVVICIERYMAIIHPMTCKQMLTLNRLRLAIIFVWIMSAVISSPRFYYFTTITMSLPNNDYEILCVPNRKKYNSRVMDMISMTLLFVIPLTIISILYCHIGIVLWRSSKARMIATNGTISGENSTSNNERPCFREATEDHTIDTIDSINLTLLTNCDGQPPEVNHLCDLCEAHSSNFQSSSSPPPNKSSAFACLKLKKMSGKAKCKMTQNIFFYNCEHCVHNEQDETSFVRSNSTCSNGCDAVVEKHFPRNGITNDLPRTTTSDYNSRNGIFCAKSLYPKFEKPTNFQTTPPSCAHNCSCMDESICSSKTDPIVLVKFGESDRKHLTDPNKKKDVCPFYYLNTKRCTINNQRGEVTASPQTQSFRCSNVHSCHQPNDNCVSNTRKRNRSEDYTISEIRSFSEQSFPQNSVEGIHNQVEGDLLKPPGSGQIQSTLSHQPSANSQYCYEPDFLHHSHYHCHYEPQRHSPSSPPPTLPLKRPRGMRVVRSSKYGTSALQSRRKIIRMLIVVVLTFAVCHLPFHARKVWQYWSPTWAPYEAGGVFSTLFTPVTFLIMYANSGINPILYAFMSKKFRMSFRDLLCCRMRHSLRISRNASLRSTHAVPLSQTGL